MYAAVSRCEHGPAACPFSRNPRLERAEGTIRLGFAGSSRGTRLEICYQQGSSRVRFPRVAGSAATEAVLINTAGGLTGGDRFRLEASCGSGGLVSLATQAAEKVYRATEDTARLDVSLRLGTGATLHWLPQETILFDSGRLARRLDVEMAEDARLILCEPVVLGRSAHGETVRRGMLKDSWRIRRGGRLIYADALNLEGDIEALVGRTALFGGAQAFASLLAVAPDAGDRIETVRDVLAQGNCEGGASAWDGLLAVRLVAMSGVAMRTVLNRLLPALGARLPRVWTI